MVAYVCPLLRGDFNIISGTSRRAEGAFLVKFNQKSAELLDGVFVLSLRSPALDCLRPASES
jgi:hypothetical protein